MQSIEMSKSFKITEPEDQATFYDRFLPHFLEQRNNSRCQDAKAWVLRGVRPGANVLEVGCGIGDLSAAMGSAGADVLAVDLSPEVINWAKKNQNCPGVKYRCQDIRTLEEGKPRFDMVIFSDSIEHIPTKDRKAVILKIGKLCKEKATVLVAWPNPLIHARATQATYQPVDERVEVHELLGELHEAGFNFVTYVQSVMANVYMKAVVQRVDELK